MTWLPPRTLVQVDAEAMMVQSGYTTEDELFIVVCDGVGLGIRRRSVLVPSLVEIQRVLTGELACCSRTHLRRRVLFDPMEETWLTTDAKGIRYLRNLILFRDLDGLRPPLSPKGRTSLDITAARIDSIRSMVEQLTLRQNSGSGSAEGPKVEQRRRVERRPHDVGR
jgi:hypothetical protein